RVDRTSKPHPRRCQTWEANVRVIPLGLCHWHSLMPVAASGGLPCQPKRLHSLITLKANLSRTSQIDQALTPYIWLSTADFDAPNSEQVIEYLAHHLPAYTPVECLSVCG